MKMTYGFFVVVCLVIGAALFTGCGDNGTNTDGIHDTLSIIVTDTTGFTLTPSATTGGTIAPSVPVKVDSGNLQIFFMKPDIFYKLDSVTADGARLPVEQGLNGFYVYVLNVTKDMAVRAWFSRRPIYYGMKLIPAGTFLLGADSVSQTAGMVNYAGDTIHQVTLSAFDMDTTEVTQAEYRGLMGVNPSYFRDSADWALRPAEQMTWYDAVLYCNARSKSEGKDTVYTYSYVDGAPGNGCGLLDLAIDYARKGYRLPTEAEWEYACKAGTNTNFLWGNDTNGMGARTWSYYNSGSSTHPVATKLANAYGLYDMTGNVWEWNNDWYGSYAAGASTDPTGAASGSYRVLRGGSWYYSFDFFRSAYRSYIFPGDGDLDFGFRCVLPR